MNWNDKVYSSYVFKKISHFSRFGKQTWNPQNAKYCSSFFFLILMSVHVHI